MTNISPQVEFFLNLAKAKTVVARRFDNRLSFHGLGLSDFLILHHLYHATDHKMRRVDLAGKIGLTASGVTRMLLPMEKIGLIKRETTEHDARVSYVALAPGGKRLYEESLERVEILADELITSAHQKKLQEFSDFLIELGKTVVY